MCSLTFAFERAQNTRPDAVDRALTPPAGQTFDNGDISYSTLLSYTIVTYTIPIVYLMLAENFPTVAGYLNRTYLKRRVGLGTGLGVNPLLVTRI